MSDAQIPRVPKSPKWYRRRMRKMVERYGDRIFYNPLVIRRLIRSFRKVISALSTMRAASTTWKDMPTTWRQGRPAKPALSESDNED